MHSLSTSQGTYELYDGTLGSASLARAHQGPSRAGSEDSKVAWHSFRQRMWLLVFVLRTTGEAHGN